MSWWFNNKPNDPNTQTSSSTETSTQCRQDPNDNAFLICKKTTKETRYLNGQRNESVREKEERVPVQGQYTQTMENMGRQLVDRIQNSFQNFSVNFGFDDYLQPYFGYHKEGPKEQQFERQSYYNSQAATSTTSTNCRQDPADEQYLICKKTTNVSKYVNGKKEDQVYENEERIPKYTKQQTNPLMEIDREFQTLVQNQLQNFGVLFGIDNSFPFFGFHQGLPFDHQRMNLQTPQQQQYQSPQNVSTVCKQDPNDDKYLICKQTTKEIVNLNGERVEFVRENEERTSMQDFLNQRSQFPK